jgi:hypothetical protein
MKKTIILLFVIFILISCSINNKEKTTELNNLNKENNINLANIEKN